MTVQVSYPVAMPVSVQPEVVQEPAQPVATGAPQAVDEDGVQVVPPEDPPPDDPPPEDPPLDPPDDPPPEDPPLDPPEDPPPEEPPLDPLEQPFAVPRHSPEGALTL